MITPPLLMELDKIQASWRPEHRISVSHGTGEVSWADDHILASQLSKMHDGKPCSLPYIGKDKISWVTFGGSQEELLEAIEDLRCWILPYLGKEEPEAIITQQNAQTSQAEAFCATVGWYFRWYCPTENFENVTKRLKEQADLLDSRPSREPKILPSLNGLRFDFVAALRTGEWSAAKKAIDTIDQLQLDSAKNTQLMHIRLLYEKGNFASLTDTIRRNAVLDSALPSRLRGLVIDAIYQSEILPVEGSRGWRDAFDQYQGHWQSKLAPYVIQQRVVSPVFPLSAYQAYSERDRETLQLLFEKFSMEIAGAMLDEIPATGTTSIEPAETSNLGNDQPPSVGRSFWHEIETAVRTGAHARAKACITDLAEAVLDDPQWIAIGAETLLEIFTDPQILGGPRLRTVAEEVLLTIIDTVVNNSNFPRCEHASIYDALIMAWVEARKESSLEVDGQLLLGLVGAAMECSVKSVKDCESAIRTWWSQKKIVRRLSWLLAALDMLVQNHPNTASLQDLWIDGASLITRRAVPLSKAERTLWRRVGRSVDLDDESIRAIFPDRMENEKPAEVDPLAKLNLRKVAVVTLQERAARQAAEELKSRTGAEVIIVTSKAANEVTRAAESADLILLVWAACSHAVYRSFDHVREKLQYVQGTGPSSIVLAAEHWAMLKKTLH